MKREILISAVFLLLSFMTFSVHADLKDDLYNTYNSYIKAAKSGDGSLIRTYMSSYSYVSAKNQVISMKRPFNNEIFVNTVEYMPKLDELGFVKVLEKGDTALLVYGKNMESEKNKEVNYIRFVKEDGRWRFDTTYSHYGEQDINDNVLMEKYEINGVVKAAPQECSEPDYSGIINATSYDYRTVVVINGIEQADVEDKSSSGIIIGGLNKGENRIDITITKIDKDAVFKPEISILKITDPKKEGEEVYKFEKEGNLEGSYTEVITID